MKALVLAAGYGTRLYPVVKNTPKALLDIHGKPLIDYICDKIAAVGDIDEVYVVTNEKFHAHIEEWAAAHTQYPFKLTVVNDGTKTPDDRLGSIGDMDFVIQNKRVQDDLLVIGGDNLFNEGIEEFCGQAANRPEVTVGLYDIKKREDAKSFGVVAVSQEGKVTSFEEKPEQPKSSLIAMCLYFFPKKTVGLISQYLVESQKSDRAGDYIKWLCQTKGVYGYIFRGKWFDIGSLESLDEAKRNFG